ncbi:RNA polymerase sigma factor [Psychroserpens sp.]|uniref:RNA polymerase sigma factor n=1 Tax=Psychroserpens sp. TaxID=2020870 RepID=UPI0038585378
MSNLESKFEAIYTENYGKVFRICQGYTNGNQVLSKDLTQETFIKVWNNLSSFRNESSLSTWIYRITVNTCLIELRKKKPVPIKQHLSHLELVIDENSKEKELQLNQLYRCINKLKIENKSIILLELEGLPQKEIADIMGLKHETIRVRIHRIKNELTKCVKQ